MNYDYFMINNVIVPTDTENNIPDFLPINSNISDVDFAINKASSLDKFVRKLLSLQDIPPWSSGYSNYWCTSNTMYTSDYAVNSKISLCEGDKTKLNIDCIVNAATETLEEDRGIDGAIHRTAGPDILKACNKLPFINKSSKRCETCGCRLTDGFNLPSNYILHTVGSRDPDPQDASHKLESCYESCLRQVLQNNIKGIAFFCIAIWYF